MKANGQHYSLEIPKYLNYSKKLCFFVLFFPIIFSLHCNPLQTKTPPRAVQGVLDLREYDLQSIEAESIDLDGEWEFYWNEFPDPVSHSLNSKNKNFISVPGSWNGHSILNSSDKIESFGFATYKLKIYLKNSSHLSFRIPHQSTSSELYINNKLIHASGKLGISKETSIPNLDVTYKNLNQEEKELVITFLISNFHHSKGGFRQSLKMGNAEYMSSIKTKQLAIDLFVAGILFIMGIYHFSLYLYRKDDRSPIFFGIFCLFFSLRTLITGEIFYNELIHNSDYTWMLRLEYSTIYISTPIFIEFIYNLYPDNFNKILKISLQFYNIIFCLLLFITEPFFFTKTLIFYQAGVLVLFFYLIFFLIKGAFQKLEGTTVFLVGTVVSVVLLIHDILASQNIIKPDFYGTYGFVIFIFSQSNIISSRFSMAFKISKELSENLEIKIQERTINLEKEKEKSKSLNQMIEVVIQSQSTDDIFEKIFDLFRNKYNLPSFLVYMVDDTRNFLQLQRNYGNASVSKKYMDIIHKNQLEINNPYCAHGSVIIMNRSLIVKKIKMPHKYLPENENIIEGGIDSLYIIPLIAEGKSFGTISFANSKFQYADIKNISKSNRLEIENFIKLISPSIYQVFQKTIIERAYADLQKTQIELESKKSQIERLQKMSEEIQRKSQFSDMILTLENLIWDSYRIGDFFIYIKDEKNNSIKLYYISSSLREKIDMNTLSNIPMDDDKSLHSKIMIKKRSIYYPKLYENISTGDSEDKNRITLGMKSLFLIPFISDDSVFAIISFSDIKSELSKNNDYLGVRKLNPKQRHEIEQLVSLISNALYQSLQKTQIQNAYSELKSTQEALSRAERSASLNSMVSHLAHEVNNPLNYISTGEMITKESVEEAKSFVLGAIPDSFESKPFVDKIKSLFGEINLGLQQTEKGRIRIKDTIQEIRAITGVDGIHVDNFDLVPLMYSNWELSLEKNQIPLGLVSFDVNGVSWPESFSDPMVVLSQKYIFSRAIRTLLNNSIYFAKKNSNPKIQVEIQKIQSSQENFISISIRNNGPSIEDGKESKIFDLKSSKYFGTELIGLPFVKEILQSVQCNLSLIDNGRNSGWVEFQIVMKDFV